MSANTTTNIIRFPIKKNVNFGINLPQTRDEADDRIYEFQEEYIENALSCLVPMIFETMEKFGFVSFESMATDKPGAMIVETIRSYMCGKYGMDHSFQKMADKIFDVDEEGDVSIKKNLQIIFRNKPKTEIKKELEKKE